MQRICAVIVYSIVNNMRRTLFLIFLWFNGLSIAPAQSGSAANSMKANNIVLAFTHVAGKATLNFDSSYTNHFGEIYTIRKFKYYVSNLIFENTTTGKSEAIPDSYFLVDEAQPASKKLSFTIPSGYYNAVTFTLGVDSLKNVSGAQTGALDPLNDMFWTWNTGYVMAKMEGASPASKLPRHMIEYHIGGYKKPYATLQSVRLYFKQGKEIEVSENGTTTLYIQADINAWFHGTHDLKISENPACSTVGQLAQFYAENYRNMFCVTSIKER